jgi:hypothetical protein
LIKLASNLRRSKRTVGRRISSLQSAVARIQKRPAPQRLGPGTVERENLAPNADGKTRVFYQNDAPANPTDGLDLVAGDLWFDTNDGSKMYRWDGSTWSVAVLSGTNITAGTINASLVNVSNINAGNITSGTLTSREIVAGTPSGGLYPFRVEENGTVRSISGFVGGFNISSTGLSVERNVSGTVYRSEIFTNNESVYVPSNVRGAGGNGFYTETQTTGEYSTQIPTGFFVSTSTGYAAYRENYVTVMVGDPTPLGRMWMDGNVLKYTTTGTGSFPGLITTTNTSLTFDTDTIDSFGRIRSTAKSGQEFCFVAEDSSGNNTIAARSDGGVVLDRLPTASSGGNPVYITAAGALREFTSSLRVKENVEYYSDSAISVLKKLKPATYTYKRTEDDTDFTYQLKQLDKMIGLIVEDVEEVQKDLEGIKLLTYKSATKNSLGSIEHREKDPYTSEKDFENVVPQMYRIESIMALCVKGIQELSARIDSMEEKSA